VKLEDVSSVETLDRLEARIRDSADATFEGLRRLISTRDPLGLLEALKFDPVGFDPLNPDSPLNLIEQVNQTFTYLVSLEAVRVLLKYHPESAPYRMNLGTKAGSDVQSADGRVAAEVFAAVSPSNNRKLQKDILKVNRTDAEHRYVFFLSPGEHQAREVEGVKVIPVSLGAGGFKDNEDPR